MANLREISPEEWEKEEYKNYIPIDIRDEAEYQLGHMENAEWRAISDLLGDEKTLDKSKAFTLLQIRNNFSRAWRTTVRRRISGCKLRWRLREVHSYED